MITALELIAGLVLTGAFAGALAVVAALELGRMVTRDDEQREVESAAREMPRFRTAA